MARLSMFFIVMGLVLDGCSPNQNPSKALKDSSIVTTASEEQLVQQDIPGYLAKQEEGISIQDSETAYEMCTRALTDYYKAVWNGSDIQLDSWIDNENLKRYTLRKIQYQSNLHAQSNDPVKEVEVVDWEAEYIDGDLLYVKCPADIKKAVGSYGEVTEFLIRNVDGKLFIADWYTGSKDSYDVMVRGEDVTISNPDIWNNREWVTKLEQKQHDFTGSVR